MKKRRNTVNPYKRVPDFYFHRVSTAQKRRARRKLQIAFLVSKGLFIAVMLAALGLGLWAGAAKLMGYVKNDKVFTVSRLVIKNNWKVSVKTVEQIAAVGGKNIFEVDLRAVKSALEHYPFIRRAVVNRHLPSTVEIIVFEREPFACIPGDGSFWAVDREGYVIAGPEGAKINDLPLLSGLQVTGVKVGRRLAGDEIEEILSSLVYFYLSGSSARINVQEVELASKEGIIFTLKGSTRVVLGRGNYEKKLGRLELIYNDLAAKHAVGALIDLRFNDAIVKLIGE